MKISKVNALPFLIVFLLPVHGFSIGNAVPDTLGKGKSAVQTQEETLLLLPDTILLKKHITTLADDAMEGRETGTAGEKLAYEYLSGEFRRSGLLPKGTQGYIQPFP